MQGHHVGHGMSSMTQFFYVPVRTPYDEHICAGCEQRFSESEEIEKHKYEGEYWHPACHPDASLIGLHH